MYRLTLQAGDWSCDGHGLSEVFVIDSNLTQGELVDAYKDGVKHFGIDLTEEVCEDYEDARIPEDLVKKLYDSGFDINKFHSLKDGTFSYDEDGELVDDSDNCEEPRLCGETFKDVWLHFCRIGNPQFQYKEINTRDVVIQLGAYGCFSH